MNASQFIPPAPAVLRLVQVVMLGRWRATGEELYREVVKQTDAGPGREILVAGCGEGAATEWFATRTGAAVTGVDADADRIEAAEERARALESPLPLTYQHAPLDDLPHETSVFDISIGEPALAAAADPARAVAELARVTKPMGCVILLQLTSNSDAASRASSLLRERLGLTPHLLMEWKQMLRDAGVVELQVQDWTTGGPGPSARGTGSAPAVQDPSSLSWQQKMQIVGRAWRRWGWRGARGAVEREKTLFQELGRERAIGFQLIKGVKWPHAITT
ncbi:MAG: class I SAM-dependent methyltransferase [Gemmatimonadaceae bacterium]